MLINNYISSTFRNSISLFHSTFIRSELLQTSISKHKRTSWHSSSFPGHRFSKYLTRFNLTSLVVSPIPTLSFFLLKQSFQAEANFCDSPVTTTTSTDNREYFMIAEGWRCWAFHYVFHMRFRPEGNGCYIFIS